MESGQGVQLLTRACGDGIMDRCCSIFFKARVSFTISQPHCFFKASRCNSQGFSLLLLDEPSNHLDLDAWKLRFKDVLFQGRADDGLRPDLSFPFSLSVSFPSVMRCVALLDTTRRELGEKEHDRSFGLKNFRYIEEIKEALERECPGLVSCSDILVLYARERIEAVGGPHIPLKTGRRDGRKSRTDMLESYLPDHNESISVVLDKFKSIGIDTPGLVALLGSHSVGRTHCVKLVHRLYPEVDPSLNPDHVPHMLHKCPDSIPDPKAVQYVRNDRGTPMVLDNNYYRNILDNKGLLLVDHQLAHDKRTRPIVKKMAKDQAYFFKEFTRAIQILSENNPLTGSKGEIRKQCNLANKIH